MTVLCMYEYDTEVLFFRSHGEVDAVISQKRPLPPEAHARSDRVSAR